MQLYTCCTRLCYSGHCSAVCTQFTVLTCGLGVPALVSTWGPVARRHKPTPSSPDFARTRSAFRSHLRRRGSRRVAPETHLLTAPLRVVKFLQSLARSFHVTAKLPEGDYWGNIANAYPGGVKGGVGSAGGRSWAPLQLRKRGPQNRLNI